MCLLYSILYGEGNGCGCRERENRCGRSSGRSGCGCGCANAQNFGDFQSADFASANGESCFRGCCCNNRNCGGFGRHGGLSVCCDEEYYMRQYALCNCCCNCRRGCGECGCCGRSRNC